MVHAQRLVGKKGIFLPDEKSSPEQIAEFRKALDVPEKPEDYEVKPDNIPEGLEWNDDLAKQFIDIAHKHNVPKAAMKEMARKFQEMETLRVQAGWEMAQAENKRRYDEGIRTLQAAWGNEMPKQIELVQRAAARYGAPVDSPGWSDPAIVKFIANMARSMSEDTFVSPNGAQMRSPYEMAMDIVQNPDNPEYKLYRGGHKPTQAKVEDLFKEAERLELQQRR